ncbi:MAG: hypothetical protein WBD22_02125 [Pyrinomonadaceae bacterium]
MNASINKIRLIPISLIATLTVAFFASGSSVSCGPGDCGYQARFKKPDGVSTVEIRIQRITAETVGSVTSCGYQFIWTKASKMEIGRVALPERVGNKRIPETYVNFSDQGGVDYYYEAPASFDPRKDIIRIETKDGSRYTSRPETIKEHSADSITVVLK